MDNWWPPDSILIKVDPWLKRVLKRILFMSKKKIAFIRPKSAKVDLYTLLFLNEWAKKQETDDPTAWQAVMNAKQIFDNEGGAK